MKLIYSIISLSLIVFLLFMKVKVQAATDDYNTFSEIMMPTGKLLSNFTDEEIKDYLKKVNKRKFFGLSVYTVNKNVEASYISNTLYSVSNLGSTDVTYEIEVEVETANKVSFTSSGSLNGQVSGGKSGGLKGEIGGKCGIEISTSSTASRKEKQKMKLVVEGNSKAIVYLTGNLSVTNGVAANYISFFRSCEGGFEIITLKNQYARIEKRKIWKR